jgi:hypothetical protein
MKYIREHANGRSFSVYHYDPSLYDYAYQYLYFIEAEQGKPLPVDFSYKPNEQQYILDKPVLVSKYASLPAPAEVIYYVVEKPEKKQFLKQWWDAQSYDRMLDMRIMSSDVLVYSAQPKSGEK